MSEKVAKDPLDYSFEADIDLKNTLNEPKSPLKRYKTPYYQRRRTGEQCEIINCRTFCSLHTHFDIRNLAGLYRDRIRSRIRRSIARSSNGRTAAFEAVGGGSNPPRATV